jgi:penicillin amidase
LPREFSEMGTKPAKWAAEDVVRIRTHAWMRNVLSEVLRANVMAKAGADVDLLRQNLDPPKPPAIPEALDLESIPIEALDIYRLAIVPVSFKGERLKAGLDRVEA